MAILKCKMCGGDLNLVEGASTAACEYCGSVQTVPKVDDEKKLTLFARANRLRATCEFDKAAGIYEAIVADFPEEAEAYWGLVLCKYGIEYVDDPATGNKIPTCHRSSFDSLLDDSDCEQALENADPAARKVYREEIRQIEEIRKGIIAVSNNEQPYDIFICYKETDESGNRTLDSVLAQDVYDVLTDKGYRVFFSRISLEDKLGVEYEPYIFAALNSAKIMLAFGTDYEYFNAVWVKNEWSRFLKLMAKDREKHLIPCFKGIDAYDMPKEFARLQAQDLGKLGATQDLLRGIEKLLPKTQANTERQAPKEPAGQRPAIIQNISAIASNDTNDPWPKGTYSDTINRDTHSVIYFHATVDTAYLQKVSTLHSHMVIYNSNNQKLFDQTGSVDWKPNHNRYSKGWIVRGSDGTYVPTGRYRMVLEVENSLPFETVFYVTSNKEIASSRQVEKTYAPARRPVNKWLSFFLCLLLGYFGAHKFYEGKYLLGALYFFTGGLFCLGWLYDCLAILCKPDPYYV